VSIEDDMSGKSRATGVGAAAEESAAEAGGGDSGETEGFKWSLKAFRKWLSQRESPEIMTRTFQAIDDVVVKTIIAAEPELTHSLHTCELISLVFKKSFRTVFSSYNIPSPNLQLPIIEPIVSNFLALIYFWTNNCDPI
jgi:hypothetical protein